MQIVRRRRINYHLSLPPPGCDVRDEEDGGWTQQTMVEFHDPVVLTSVITFVVAFLAVLTCIILVCCYFLR